MACQECLDQLQNLDNFGLRFVQANEMFLELFNDSDARDKADLCGEQNHWKASAQSLELKNDNSCEEYLEIEYIEELVQPEHADADCAGSSKSDDNYIDGNASDNAVNIDKSFNMEYSYDGNDIIYEEEVANDFQYVDEVTNNDVNCKMEVAEDVSYKEEDTEDVTYEEADANDIIYEVMDANDVIYEEENEINVKYEEKDVEPKDFSFSNEGLDNIEVLDDLNDVKKKPTKKKCVRSKTIFSCTFCDMKFYRPRAYTNHLQTKHSQDVGPVEYACDKCPKRFAYAYRLKDHQLMHLPDDEKQHQCPQCSTKFGQRKNLLQHIRFIHNKDLPIVCDECGKFYRSITALNVHKIVHATTRPCQCPKCPKTFKDPWHLRLHMETHNDLIYECSICEKRMKTRRALRDHMVVHTDVKKFKCPMCELVFKRKGTLRVSYFCFVYL